MRKVVTYISALLSVCAWQTPRTAQACGGFFCSRTPVDQSAERILFKVRDGETDMVVQITYQGRDEDFAWVLPVASVPQNRDVFPQMALNSLDGGTAPIFQLHEECQNSVVFAEAASSSGGPTADNGADNDGGVTVHVREEVGPYDVAVISSPDADASITWLKDEGYNIADPMVPYIHLYTEADMKFLALKLTANSNAGDITPFRMTLPGETPVVPLRLTSLAAGPEMGVLVWVFGDKRFEPANSEEVEINNDLLRWDPWSWGSQNNWAALVANEVNRYEGKAWVAEMAGSTKELISQVETSPTRDEDQEKAKAALLDVIGDSAYLTRLYTRVSAEEMLYDPSFKRSDKADVDRVKQLPYVEELCGESDPPPPVPCDFATCGAWGLCRNVSVEDTNGATLETAACACAPGTSARSFMGPDGRVAVSCQDERMSFMNPGELSLRGDVFPDTCADYDCGPNGQCVTINLTPTCECDKGYVARGWMETEADGSTMLQTRCVPTSDEIEEGFYNRRLPQRPAELPSGRDVELENAAGPPDIVVIDYGEPMTPTLTTSSGCSSVGTPGRHQALWMLLLGLGVLGGLLRRRAN